MSLSLSSSGGLRGIVQRGELLVNRGNDLWLGLLPASGRNPRHGRREEVSLACV